MTLLPPFHSRLDADKGLIVIRTAAGKPVAVVDDCNSDVAYFITHACNAYTELVATMRDIAKRGGYIGGDECSDIAEKALKAAGVK